MVADNLVFQNQMMFGTAKVDALAAGKNLMPPMLLIPLCQSGGHVHLLDDVPPAHPGVVSAKGNLSLLRSVGDNALLGPAEIVFEQILEPLARHEQQVPAVAPAAEDVSHRPLARDVAIIAPGCAQSLIEFSQHIERTEMGGRAESV